jgi:hypothetical protein
MCAAGRGWFLPCCDFILADNFAIAFGAAVAGRAGASSYTQKLARLTRAVFLSVGWLGETGSEYDHREQQRRDGEQPNRGCTPQSDAGQSQLGPASRY